MREDLAVPMASSITLGEVARLVDGELRGDAAVEIRGVAPIASAGSGDLTWLAERKYLHLLDQCQATAVLVVSELGTGQLPAVACDRPDLGIAAVLERLRPPLPHPPSGVDPSATVAASVQLGQDVAVGPRAVIQQGADVGPRTVIHAGVFVGENTVIGADCVIWPNVVIRERCVVGQRVTIHPNTTIGADGFGYNFHEGRYRRIAHIGRVCIGDDVEIGANSCVDRAKCGETFIGRGSKIDNLVQIAHNVRIGEDCCIIAHVGVAGSTVVGDHVTLAGKVGVRDNITIGSRAQAAACSCIAADVAEGETVLGIPARPKAEFYKEHAALRRLPNSAQRIRELFERVERLEAANNSKTR